MQIGARLKNKNSSIVTYQEFQLLNSPNNLLLGPFIRDTRYRARNLFGRKMNRVYHAAALHKNFQDNSPCNRAEINWINRRVISGKQFGKLNGLWPLFDNS